MNRKMLVRLIEREHSGKLLNAFIMEADDGSTALEILRVEMAAGRTFDFILMDFVMVTKNSYYLFESLNSLFVSYSSS